MSYVETWGPLSLDLSDPALLVGLGAGLLLIGLLTACPPLPQRPKGADRAGACEDEPCRQHEVNG